MRSAITDYIQWMHYRNFALTTIQARARILEHFRTFLEERNVFHPHEVASTALEDFQGYLHQYRKINGEHLSLSCQRDRLVSMRGLFRWLHEHNRIGFNPAAKIVLPRTGRVLPRTVLSAAEMDQVLEQPDVTTPEGSRDRAMMELLYSTGIRRAEAAGLAVADIDEDRQLLRVRQGKGRKDRVVPIGRNPGPAATLFPGVRVR